MEDRLEALMRRRTIGSWLVGIGCLLFVLGGAMGLNRTSVSDASMESTCTIDGQPADCQSLGLPMPAGPISTQPISTHTEPNMAFYGVAFLLIFGGILVLGTWQAGLNNLKMDLIYYANRRAEAEGTTPNLNFLFFFDSRRRGPAEWELLRNAYSEMVSYNPHPVSYGADADRPYRTIPRSNVQPTGGDEKICAACGAKNEMNAAYCKSCGRPLEG